MNGLKIIRIRCNLSANEIANILGVSRQLISSWENGRKNIPAKRSKQLSDFFGIDETLFGEITEEQKTYIIEKAMFEHKYNSKEIFKFKPDDGTESIRGLWIHFRGEVTETNDEIYERLIKTKKETLKRAEKNMHKHKDGRLEDEITAIKNGTSLYNRFNDITESIDNNGLGLKVPYRFEILDVLDAMKVAFGLMDEETVKGYTKSEYRTGFDSEWILELAEMIKKHWEEIKAYHISCREKAKAEKRKNIPPYAPTHENGEPLTLEEQIRLEEERVKKFRIKTNDSICDLITYKE